MRGPSSRLLIHLLAVKPVAEIKAEHAQHRCHDPEAQSHRTPQIKRVQVANPGPGISCIGKQYTVYLLFDHGKTVLEIQSGSDSVPREFYPRHIDSGASKRKIHEGASKRKIWIG